MAYSINQMKNKGTITYYITYNKVVIFSTTCYNSLVRFLQREKDHREKLGLSFIMKASTKALQESLDEDVYSYTY